MNKRVVKFGGSNLKTASSLRRSAQVAAAYGSPLVVVVSAFFGVTDAIAEGIREALASLEAAEALMEKLRMLHHEVIAAHIFDDKDRLNLHTLIDERLAELEHTLKGIYYIGTVPDFIRDKALSCGERLSSPIITAVLNAAGIRTAEALPEKIGLMTDGRYGNASVDMDACGEAVGNALAGDISYVVPGFYGMTRDGNAAIFGRGGSDYTAAVLARCISAESLDLWKDVDGFLSSDPRINPESTTIRTLSYEEAAELAYFGAKVLHPRTVEPLEDTEIPIRVMNIETFSGTIEPYSTVGPGSKQRQDREEKSGAAGSRKTIKSVASSDDVGIIRIEGPGVGLHPGVLARATGRLDTAGVNISSVITAQTCINFIFRRDDMDKALAVLKAESISGVIGVKAIEDCAMVAAVGAGIRDSVGVGSRVLGALAEKGINVILAQAGASPVAIYLLVRRDDREKAVRAIHQRMESMHEGN
ncbi:aspartate kinase [Treponema sp. OttesenSCG-928-L16]|nr:aspartate kinase [Treponema sp. OttesenSCG-928-L16]